MQEVTIGPMTFSVGAENLVLADPRRPQQSLFLPIGHIPDLIRFLNGLDYRGYMRAFRVPVDGESGLEVSISDGSQAYDATPNNISLVGICADLHEIDDETILAADSDVTIDLTLGDKAAQLPGIVRRRKQLNVGIEFSGSFRNGCLSPPDDLRQIVAPLEIRWIRQKAQRSTIVDE